MENNSSYKQALIKGICNGIICSLVINIWIIISFYLKLNSFCFYLMGLPLAVITYLLLKQSKIRLFLSAWLISIFLYIVTEIALTQLGVINLFFQRALGDGIKMTAGDGFGIMVITLFNLVWVAVGLIAAFIKTFITQRKANEVNVLE